MVSCATYLLPNFITYCGAKPAVSKSTGILKWSPTNGHKIVPVLISLNRALRKNHPHQRDQIKFSKTSMQVLYARMDFLSYPTPWQKAKPQSTDGLKMKEDPLDNYNSHFLSMCFLAPPHSCSCPTLVEENLSWTFLVLCVSVTLGTKLELVIDVPQSLVKNTIRDGGSTAL